ncbi:MAG: hypothetical protein U0176_11550 [Bacteroidia bacterium]
MSATPPPPPSAQLIQAGRRQFLQILWGSLGLCAAVTAIEVATWNAPVFLIGYGVLTLGLAGLYRLLFKGHSLRWLIFVLLLLLGAYTFLLGGLHMGVINEDPVDPLCYVIAAAGLALVGIGGYSAYSPEIDAFLASILRKKAADAS